MGTFCLDCDPLGWMVLADSPSLTGFLGKLAIRLLCRDDVKGLWENTDLGGRESQTDTFSGDWKEEHMWGVMPRSVCLIWGLGKVMN